MKKILELKKEISVKAGIVLNCEIESYIQEKKKIPCKGLNRRPIFLDKYLEATKGRIDKTRRRQKFWPGLELIRRAKLEDMTNKMKEPTGETSFEFKGITPGGESVGVHIREILEGKDKKLYLISTF